MAASSLVFCGDCHDVIEPTWTAKRYLVPRQLAEHGLKKSQLKITVAALRELLDGYARDPGVRTAEKLVKKVVRKTAVKLLGAASAWVADGWQDRTGS